MRAVVTCVVRHLSTDLRLLFRLVEPAWSGRAMDELPITIGLDEDRLFTLSSNLMWQLYYEAAAQGVPGLEIDLLAAFGALDAGPWRHLGSTPDIPGVPFTVLCSLLDRLLVELLRVTPGLAARVAVAKAQACLDPDHYESQPGGAWRT